MSNSDMDNYKKINKKIYEINVNLDEKYSAKYYLRNEYSFQIISNIFKSWEFYLGNYRVSNNVNIIEGPDLNTKLSRRMSMYVNDTSIWNIPFAKLSNQSDIEEVDFENGKKVYSISEYNGNYYNRKSYNAGEKNNDNQAFFTFPWNKQQIVNFSWNQPYKLNEIEKLTNFEVKSKGVISQFSNGGYLLFEVNNNKIIAAPYEINSIDGKPIKNNTGNLQDVVNNPTSESLGSSVENTAILTKAGENTTGDAMNSFNKSQSANWSIPSAKELLLMYIKLNKIGVLELYEYKYYLSSTLPKKDKGYYTYVISDTFSEELHSDFISKIKISLDDFINNNFEKYLTKCLNTSDITIKPIKYVTQ